MNDWTATRREAMETALGLAGASLLGTGLLGAKTAWAKGAAMDQAPYTPDLASLHRHHAPAWFKDAKLGIFVHWGPYSIPGFAATARPITAMEGASPFAENPYAEWYRNSMRFPGSSTAAYHARTYGADAPYEAFGAAFNRALDQWDPHAWADQFARAGAGYAVLVTKHHDGFLLWPSATPNPHIPNWGTTRDVVGELAAAVRARGMKFGVYYSGGLDWTFNDHRIDTVRDMIGGVPQDPAYLAYIEAHFAELIDRYRPDYLWNDIAYPSEASFLKLAAHYYNAVPGGLINDRWMSPAGLRDPHAFDKIPGVTGLLPPKPVHYDVRTPEYGLFDRLLPFDWETTRGIGKSFGWNRAETNGDLLSPAAIVQMLTQAACFNGNVLLNTGPRGDASLDPAQTTRLDALGVWLRTYGEAIRGTRPVALEGPAPAGLQVGATKSARSTYLHLIGPVPAEQIALPLPPGAKVKAATLLGGRLTHWAQVGNALTVQIAGPSDAPTQIVKLNLRA